MAEILRSLNKEWSAIADSPAARQALVRWSAAHPVLTSAADLNGVIHLGFDLADGPEVRRALVALGESDGLAARTLLQGLLGGLCNLAHRVGRDNDALDDIIGLAWERIRTYPVHRPGSVSGNVLLDVRKRYAQQHAPPHPAQLVKLARVEPEPSAEDHALRRAFFDEVVAASEQTGVSLDVLETIMRSRVNGESMADLAAEHQISRKVLWHRRWRAEGRIRDQLSAA